MNEITNALILTSLANPPPCDKGCVAGKLKIVPLAKSNLNLRILV